MSLDLIQSAVLIQDIDWRERLNLLCICPVSCSCGLCLFNCCEKENSYSLIYSDETFENLGQVIYRFSEEPSFFLKKCCLPPSHRPLDLKGANIFSEVSITVERPFKCTFFCFARPVMIISYKTLFIGKIIEPVQCQGARCVFHELRVYDKNDALTYVIKASLCQCSAFCFCDCSANCRDITFGIHDRSGEQIGSITHIFGGYMRELCTKADKFGIRYPSTATVEEKILITVAALFIDYLIFENM